ncbi:hypothetical protein BGZ97_003215 [Linnemannia gamsii]|uniref:Poly(A) RNA polymerase mitochondrial-like central palm domain-containing protein n=1 Tax=Linnemannia gamsii TaxID=64522 RepID=A0A9P6UTF1_9FUNG|nr:hypothetical protein BGZ97_003215 [Linnemannia gamsii]
MRLDEARLEEQRQLKEKQKTEEQSKKREKRRKPKIDALSENLSAIQVSQRSRPSNNKNIKALSGLCRMESDADFTVYNFVQPFLEGNPIDELAKALRWAGCQSVTTIATARVPIIKFVAWGVQCDMSIDQPMAVHNSRLIGAYRKADKRFLKLWFAVRYIARNHGILSGSAGYLSSYALVMMLIVFLQDVANPPILPRLQQQDRSRMEECKIDGYDCSFDNKGYLYRTFGDTNITSTSQLLIDFCQFYGYIFNYATQEVNPCLGVIKDRTYDPPPRSEWDPRPRDWSICILDPFVVGWNVAGNCRSNNAAEIQQCFRTAFDALSVKDIKKAFKQ